MIGLTISHYRIVDKPGGEMAGWNRFTVALVRQQLDEPGFVLDLLIENSRGHVIRARILAKGHAADRDPTADRAALRLEQSNA